MKPFDFWQRWLFVCSVFFAISGMVVAVAGDSFVFSFYNLQMTRHFWGGDLVPENVREFKAFLFGPLGGTMTGSYILQAYIARGPFARREPWAWNAIAFALVAWFVVDSSVCAWHGAWFNIVIVNLFALAMNGLPLLFTRRYFLAAP